MHISPTKPVVYILLIFTSLPYLVFSQNIETNCGTVTSLESLEYINTLKPQIKAYERAFMLKRSNKNIASTKIMNSIPVKAHIIRSSNGTGGLCIADLNKAISNLNSIYKDAYLEFFLCDGINYIDDDRLCHFKKGDENILTETNNVSGPINIYFIDYIKNTADENICGYSLNEGRQDIIVIKNDCAKNTSSLAHEMGHLFSLLHTHGTDSETLTTELVDGSNCDTDGDGICDTPADPKLSSANVNNFCTYQDTVTDAKGSAFNPDATNIMSYSRKSCRTHFSQQQHSRMRAFYLTAKSYLACPSFNAEFSVDTNQTCEEQLTVNFKNSCSNINRWAWDMDSDGIIDYTSQNPTHTFDSGIYDITLTVSNTSKTITKTCSNFIKVGMQPLMLDENFDNFEIAGDNGWTANDVTKHGYNWYSNFGKTPSNSTGPNTDNSRKGILGKYIYAEASGAKSGDIAEFISPCIVVNYQNSELEFAYHMFGNTIGELHVDIKTDNGYINDVIPALKGGQQTLQDDAFLIQNVDLSAYADQTIKIRFRAIRGDGWNSDIAIDDIFIKTISTATPIVDTTIKVYPNPVKNDMLFVKAIDLENALNYEISNLVGRKFLSGVITNHPINVSSLSSGTYLLILSSKDAIIVKKIIK